MIKKVKKIGGLIKFNKNYKNILKDYFIAALISFKYILSSHTVSTKSIS